MRSIDDFNLLEATRFFCTVIACHFKHADFDFDFDVEVKDVGIDDSFTKDVETEQMAQAATQFDYYPNQNLQQHKGRNDSFANRSTPPPKMISDSNGPAAKAATGKVSGKAPAQSKFLLPSQPDPGHASTKIQELRERMRAAEAKRRAARLFGAKTELIDAFEIFTKF